MTRGLTWTKGSMATTLILFFLTACQHPKPELQLPKTDLAKAPMIPIPKKITPTHSAFALDQYTGIYTSSTESGIEGVANYLSEKISEKTGLRLAVNDTQEETLERMIFINQSDELAVDSPEGYQLYISKDTIILNAKTNEGAFRGVQTLRQVIPEKSNDTLNAQPIWPVPTGKILDEPNFKYRGIMLDVARHFFSVEEVKKFIDVLAYYKINTLHLHLTDDQGWRIEIKSWPKLTEVGGKTEVGGGAGGFYTQADYTTLVQYAAKHHMTIVPEVDMPGHTNAASLSYPILNGNGKPLKPYTGTRVGFSTFDTRKDTVYSFIDDVVREISALTPGPYFHIGGDESLVTKKKDYNYFVERVEKIVQKHGKRMIGWDEVANARVDSTSIAQFWSSTKNAKTATIKGMQIIMSPAKKAYLDMKYDSLSKHGLTWAAYIPVDTAYRWSPEYYEGIDPSSILGIEAPLWSETISNSTELEYLAFPRAIGYSELGWSAQEVRNWDGYKARLAKQAPFLKRMKVNYYPSALIPWDTTTIIEKD